VAGVILTARPTGSDRAASPPGIPPGLYSLNLSGEIDRLTDAIGSTTTGTGDYDLSPDGTRVVMNREAVSTSGSISTRELWIANLDGSGLRRLVSHRGSAQEAAWFPDGRRIAYSGLDHSGVRQIFILDVLTGERSQLTHEPERDAFLPDVTTDGEAILYSTNRPGEANPLVVSSPIGLLRSIDVDSGEVTTLVRNPAGFAYSPTQSPTTGAIAYTRKEGIPGNEVASLWVLEPDGTDRMVIGRSDDITWVDWPTWSPDGSMIALAVRDGAGAYATWIYDVASGEAQPLGRPAWPEAWIDADTVLVSS
jgi:Tol biopolymer transport system component